MQIDLGTLSAEQLACELAPARAGGPARTLKLASAQQLTGALRTGEQGWALTGLGCARMLLSALSWTFGKVWLQSEPNTELLGLAGELASAHALQLRLSLEELRTPRLSLTIGALQLSAQVTARSLTLEVSETIGMLRAQSALFSNFELRNGEFRVSTPELAVSDLTVDWGGAAFRLEAGTAEASALQAVQGGASLRATTVSLAALRAHGPELAIGQTRIGRIELELPPTARREPAQDAAPSRVERDEPSGSSGSSEQRAPQIDWRLFDGLAGRLRADVLVDVSVPIIGHRRATHELRVGVEGGAVEYRQLEHGLAGLEDALLDFSVREGALVLELGLPLIPTRGHGKRIVIWDLSPSDLELAQRGRVRLAVLPSFRFASRSEGEPPSEEGGSGAFRLRELALADIDFVLSLLQTPVLGAPVRELAFGELSIQGGLCHRADEPDCAGALRVAARTFRVELAALPLAGRALSGRLEIAKLGPADAAFAGFTPRAGHAVLEGVAVAALTWATGTRPQ